MPEPPRTVLSIAGSDSGGGAGIQADGKTFSVLGLHGTFAVTAVTAQNTTGVSMVGAVAPDLVAAQIRAVVEDIGVDAVKVGMLCDEAIVSTVARCLAELAGRVPIVLDPVLVSSTGAPLLARAAIGELVASVLPQATIVTPNIDEARVLASYTREGDTATMSPAELAAAVHSLGPRYVVVTGGHSTELVDVFWDGTRAEEFAAVRQPAEAAHGSGCTHSAALAALLALGELPLVAARRAQLVAAGAVRDGFAGIGRGVGPVNVLGEHFGTLL